MSPFITLMIYPLEAVSILLLGIMVIAWIVSIFQKNAGIVDLAWGISIGLVAFIAFLMGDGALIRRALFLGLVLLWAARLTCYLFLRYDEEKEDKRYARMRLKFGDQANLRFLLVFLFQGFLILLLTLFFFPINFNVNTDLSVFEWIGTVIVLVSLFGETIADWQLYQFKKNKENRGKVLDSGLWGWSRHPNYFFEWTVWVGFAIFALGSPFGWLALLSASLMFYLLWGLSGIPLAELEMLEDRPSEYQRYQQQVSSFFPWPKR